MNPELRLEPIASLAKPVIIAGPCSAESHAQVVETARQLAATDRVDVFRAGIWKPRTRPGSYEGPGREGLRWLESARQETGLPVATEVATAAHVEACLAHGVNILWVGARTTASPFSVQNVADALRGTDVPVLVKNPVSPDIELWVGALERLNRAGVTRLGAILRGFPSADRGPFRNPPMWEFAVELKKRVPGLPVLCDPSHISGERELVPLVSQRAYDLGLDGLMIESHINPDAALSDARQQITPAAVGRLLESLMERTPSNGGGASDPIELLRHDIDRLDGEILQRLAARMRIAERLGVHRRDCGVTILQFRRWEENIRTRTSLGRAMGLEENFIRDVFQAVHRESTYVQERVMAGDLPPDHATAAGHPGPPVRSRVGSGPGLSARTQPRGWSLPPAVRMMRGTDITRRTAPRVPPPGRGPDG